MPKCRKHSIEFSRQCPECRREYISRSVEIALTEEGVSKEVLKLIEKNNGIPDPKEPIMANMGNRSAVF